LSLSVERDSEHRLLLLRGNNEASLGIERHRDPRTFLRFGVGDQFDLETGEGVKRFGGRGFAPVPGDYDGDRRTDVAAYRKSIGRWVYLGTTSGPGEVNPHCS